MNGYMYHHDLLLSPDEHFALGSALARTLMSFYDTSHNRGLTDMEWKDYKATKKLYESIKGARKDLVKTKTESTLDWAGLKKELQIDDGNIIYKETGEVVSIEGLGLEEVPEIVQVK